VVSGSGTAIISRALELGKWLTWLKNVSTTAGVTAAPTVAVFITIVLLSFCSPRRMSSIYLGGWNNLKQSSPSELSPCRVRERRGYWNIQEKKHGSNPENNTRRLQQQYHNSLKRTWFAPEARV
jgi:hypothetical protein